MVHDIVSTGTLGLLAQQMHGFAKCYFFNLSSHWSVSLISLCLEHKGSDGTMLVYWTECAVKFEHNMQGICMCARDMHVWGSLEVPIHTNQ
jgi:hypothetical protein